MLLCQVNLRRTLGLAIFTFAIFEARGLECYQCVEYDLGSNQNATMAVGLTLESLPCRIKPGYLEYTTEECPTNERPSPSAKSVSQECSQDSICIMANLTVLTTVNGTIGVDYQNRPIYRTGEIKTLGVVRACAKRNFVTSRKEVLSKAPLFYYGEGLVGVGDAVGSDLVGEIVQDPDSRTLIITGIEKHYVTLKKFSECDSDNCNGSNTHIFTTSDFLLGILAGAVFIWLV